MDPKAKVNTIQKATAAIDHAQTKDLGDGIVEVIVSTNNVDRHGERLDIKGLDVSKYNGIVLLNHDYGSLPIGKSVMLKKRTVDGVQQLVSRTQFAVDQYELAATVYKLVRDGYMPDVSIGFIAYEFDLGEDGNDFVWTKSEMIEYSHVTVGANRDAKVTAKALEKIGISEEEFQTEIKDAFAKSAKMQAKSFEELLSDPEGADQLLAGATALKEAATALEATLSARPVAEKATTEDVAKGRRIKLVTARKQAQAADRLVESLITGLKESIK